MAADNGKVDVNDLHSDILLEIFSKLSVQELVRIRIVCKHWDSLVRSEFLWQKFLSQWPGYAPPQKESAFETVMAMWRSSIRVGNERWYPNPLPEFARYESRLRKAELQDVIATNALKYSVSKDMDIRGQTMMAYLRLNPSHSFEEGLYTEDDEISQVGSYLWQQFKDTQFSQCHCCQMMGHANHMTGLELMSTILDDCEPDWFLNGLRLERRELDDEGNITNASPTEYDGEIPDDNFNDQVTESRNKNIFVSTLLSLFSFDFAQIKEDLVTWYFGSNHNTKAWKDEVNQRLPVHLYGQLKALFLDNSKHCTHYYFNDGCGDKNFIYDLSLMVTDTAAYYRIIFYDL